MISAELKRSLLVGMHQAIAEAADTALAMIENSGIEPIYPPGVELSDREISSVANLRLSEDTRSALRKIVRDAAGRPVFHLLALVDGVADPDHWMQSDPWLGLDISPRKQGARDSQMWHDDFFETYWDFESRSQRDA